ncbi:MAG TPA: DMT family transporter [Saprospiraceae bacterium]|nr:DMT family transporter [Saprospiraceae bacterium]
MQWMFFLLALVAGMMMPTQAAINNKLATYVQSPVLAAFFSFAVGLVGLFLYMLVAKIPLNTLSNIKNAPPVSWLGGLCGAFFVTAVVISVPRLGIALTFSILILGQMLITLPIDHFGFLGIPVREINLPRLLGVILVIAGVFLIRRF